MVSGTYMPRESTPGVSAESEGSLGNFPKVLSAAFSCIAQWRQVLWSDESPFVFRGEEMLVYRENRTNATTPIAFLAP